MSIKRILIVGSILGLLIVFISIPMCSFAESSDLSSYSLDELYRMRDYISSVILSRSQWESVTLPIGYYVVGVDIPAGHWTISYAPGEYSFIEYFKEADETGKKPVNVIYDYYFEGLSDPKSEFASVYKYRQIDLDLKPGYHFVVTYGPVVFTPFTGRYSPFFLQ